MKLSLAIETSEPGGKSFRLSIAIVIPIVVLVMAFTWFL